MRNNRLSCSSVDSKFKSKESERKTNMVIGGLAKKKSISNLILDRLK